jgi:hypothetical protein
MRDLVFDKEIGRIVRSRRFRYSPLTQMADVGGSTVCRPERTSTWTVITRECQQLTYVTKRERWASSAADAPMAGTASAAIEQRTTMPNFFTYRPFGGISCVSDPGTMRRRRDAGQPSDEIRLPNGHFATVLNNCQTGKSTFWVSRY